MELWNEMSERGRCEIYEYINKHRVASLTASKGIDIGLD